MKTKTKTVLTGVRLTTEEDKIVRTFMEETGNQSFSAALRKIVRDWNELRRGNHNEAAPKA